MIHHFFKQFLAEPKWASRFVLNEFQDLKSKILEKSDQIWGYITSAMLGLKFWIWSTDTPLKLQTLFGFAKKVFEKMTKYYYFLVKNYRALKFCTLKYSPYYVSDDGFELSLRQLDRTKTREQHKKIVTIKPVWNLKNCSLCTLVLQCFCCSFANKLNV